MLQNTQALQQREVKLPRYCPCDPTSTGEGRGPDGYAPTQQAEGNKQVGTGASLRGCRAALPTPSLLCPEPEQEIQEHPAISLGNQQCKMHEVHLKGPQ